MPDGLRGPLLEIITSCHRCDGATVLDPEWVQDRTTTLPDVVAAMGEHIREHHPDHLDAWMSVGEAVGILRPPSDL